MNTLSWLIYIAEVVGSLGMFMGISFILLCIAFMVSMGTWLFNSDRYGDEDLSATAKHYAGKMIPYIVGLAIIGSLVPGKSTIYAIAASEMGEKALNAQTGGKAVQALNAWLDRQIEGGSEEEDKKSAKE